MFKGKRKKTFVHVRMLKTPPKHPSFLYPKVQDSNSNQPKLANSNVTKEMVLDHIIRSNIRAKRKVTLQ